MKKVQHLLENEGYRFGFFQIVKMLEEIHADRPRIGHLGPFDQEVVHIRPSVDLSFSPADVKRVERRGSEDDPPSWELIENFLGLYGPNASAPIFIAEMIAQNPKDEDPLQDFLDIFNHRLLSLYYRTWKKYNLAANITPQCDDPISVMFRSLIGADMHASSEDWVIPPERLLAYTSYFSSNSRPAGGLENLLSDYFGIDEIEVVQFVPRKFKPPTGDHSCISSSGEFGRLGQTFVLGDVINDVSGQFKIRLKHLNMNQFEKFQPGELAYDELVFLTNLYTKFQLAFCLELVLQPGQGGPAVMSSEQPIGAMGRSAWVGFPTEKETVVTLDIQEVQ